MNLATRARELRHQQCGFNLRALYAVWLRAVIAALSCALHAVSGYAASPNIVLISSDDAGYNDFGFMAELNGSSTDAETPNLDALARQSVVMSNGYAASPLCSPSRAGLLTGRYQQRIGYEDNPGTTDGFEAGQQLMSHQLKEFGYTTGAIGKWHLGETSNVNRPLDMGFDEFFGFFGGGRPFWSLPNADSSRQIRRGNTNIEQSWGTEGDPSRYDPVNGRYLTDAFGEEAASFIHRHAGDENPFFLYVALNAPHTPIQAKQADLNRFAHIADPARRTVLAMNYGLDRAVGDITSALAANGIEDNTIVVFMNDNGGTSVSPHSNYPLRGHKGSTWEGGIRVPFMIKAPGLAAGTYDAPITSLDLMPTFVAAAGGDLNVLETDGTDLLPFLSGDVSGQPHELIFWRSVDRYAVRRGDWKLIRTGNLTFPRLHRITDDVHEDIYLNSQHPELVDELRRELTFWEAQLEKPKWGPIGYPRNRFDHFVFRNDLAAVQNWSAESGWRQAGTANEVTFLDEDAYANAILEFSTRDDADYTATNDMRRATKETFMLNEIRLTGNFAGVNQRVGTINGQALLFVSSLDGSKPGIELTATSEATSPQFVFQLDNEIQLLDDLVLSGNGTQELVISSNIRDFYEPRGLTKTGTSNVTLTGSSTYRGSLTVNKGSITLDGPNAAIDGPSAIVIESAGEFELANGSVTVHTLDTSAGGAFNFHGGTLKTVQVIGDLVNNGGTFAPGASAALASIEGGFTQNDGKLQIEIGGTSAGNQFDQLVVSGDAVLGETLEVKLINNFIPSYGQEFEVLTASGSVLDEFDAFLLPALTGGLQWGALATNHSFSLLVGLPGDFNKDGCVDGSDYTLWRDTFGATVAIGTGADGNRDGQVNQLDFEVWRDHFGARGLSEAVMVSAATVPEPGVFTLLLIGVGSAVAIGTVRRCRPRPRRQHTIFSQPTETANLENPRPEC